MPQLESGWADVREGKEKDSHSFKKNARHWDVGTQLQWLLHSSRERQILNADQIMIGLQGC